jgi:hypothetical protein
MISIISRCIFTHRHHAGKRTNSGISEDLEFEAGGTTRRGGVTRCYVEAADQLNSRLLEIARLAANAETLN